MGGVVLHGVSNTRLVPPDKMQIFVRPANLSGASVTSGSIGGDTPFAVVVDLVFPSDCEKVRGREVVARMERGEF